MDYLLQLSNLIPKYSKKIGKKKVETYLSQYRSNSIMIYLFLLIGYSAGLFCTYWLDTC